MGKRATAPNTAGKGIARFDFATHKYGFELLVDAGSTTELPDFVFHRDPHRLMFYDVLLVRHGRGRLLQEDRWHPVRPGSVVFHAPGEVRRWRLSADAEGMVLFFTAEFLRSFLRDQAFLKRLPFFRPGGPRALHLERAPARELDAMMEAVRGEIQAGRWGGHLMLQAETVRALVWLRRRLSEQDRDGGARPAEQPWYGRFEDALDRNLRERERRVGRLARELGMSPSHLRARVREHTGRSVRDVIRDRVVREARALLLQTDQTVSEIAHECGFDDPSHFSRYFRRAVGHSPRTFREIAGSS